ncbi:MAG: carboxypeptidase-like regulatory domain-containing protein [Candidatus Thiodiazotropha endolucinida]
MNRNESLSLQTQREQRTFQAWHTLFILFSLSVLTACASPGYYSFTREVTGHVVDGATGVPLEDVIVVGTWPGIGSTHCGDHEAMRSHVHETTTDRTGAFRIPGCIKTTGDFFHSDAVISLYKKDYLPKKSRNSPFWNTNIGKGKLGYIGPGWVWQFQGSVIELEPSGAISKTRLHKILKSKNIRVVSDYDSVPFSDCYWMKMPRMTMAIGHRKREIKDTPEMQKKPLAQYLVDHWFESPEQCHPDPVGYLMEYKDYEE